MSDNVRLIDKYKCTGCGACSQVCPNACIVMREDNEGFSCPDLDEAQCIKCGKCLKTCPAIHVVSQRSMCGYAAVNKDEILILKSSSGGMFPLFAKNWIKEGGYICAAKMIPNHEVQHCVTNKVEDIPDFQGSKYVQSYAFRCYMDMKKVFEAGNKILFFGTPCQVQGVKLLFNKFSEQLCTVDLICHGVPSPMFFKEHIDREYQKKTGLLEEICFREKTKYETNIYRLKLQYGKKTKRVYAAQDAYYAAFLDSKSFRESCYQCNFATAERCGDITIGDCATTVMYKEFPYGNVLSTVLINTEKGMRLWKNVEEEAESCILDVEEEIKANHQLHEPCSRPRERSDIYVDWRKLSKEDFNKKYIHRLNAKEYIKRIIKRVLPVSLRRKILRGLQR